LFASGSPSSFFTRDGAFFVNTEGSDGELHDYQIAYTFGTFPLPQYLIHPGGSGFSFSDLAADFAGNMFALAATQDAESARATQQHIMRGARIEDYLPDLRGLPEGLTRDQFQEEYGGLGGEGTRRVMGEINRRFETLWSPQARQ